MRTIEDIEGKVHKSATELRRVVRTEWPKGRVVMVKGAYDLLHAGHLRSFLTALSFGDCLVVGVNSDEAVSRRKGPARPIVGEEDRALMVAAYDFVSAVCVYGEESPYNLIAAVEPDVFAASHFESLTHEERSALEARVDFVEIPKVGETNTTALIARVLRGSGR